MPFLAFVWGAVVSLVPFIVRYVAVGLGFGLIAFTGISVVLDQVETTIMQSFEGLGSDLYAILAMAGFPLGIKILFSAYGVALGIKVSYAAVRPTFRGSPAA